MDGSLLPSSLSSVPYSPLAFSSPPRGSPLFHFSLHSLHPLLVFISFISISLSLINSCLPCERERETHQSLSLSSPVLSSLLSHSQPFSSLSAHSLGDTHTSQEPIQVAYFPGLFTRLFLVREPTQKPTLDLCTLGEDIFGFREGYRRLGKIK